VDIALLRGETATGESRRKFDQDFKEGAVRVVRETGRPVAQVARELGSGEDRNRIERQAGLRIGAGLSSNRTTSGDSGSVGAELSPSSVRIRVG
jgi:transposase-like protein